MKKDLTRWNRAGLDELHYVEGNAVTHLEALRKGMVEQFTEDGALKWAELESGQPEDESEREAHTRMLAQYHRGERGDYAWEILRSFSRSVHVLGGHLNTFANESYLRTANEWEHIRRLVKMIDYHPAPPASATTKLALMAKQEKAGEVLAGLAVKNQPEDGSKAVTFETLEDIVVDPALNRMMVRGWNQSQIPFSYAGNDGHLELAEPLKDVSVGSHAVLVMKQDVAAAVRVTSLSDTSISIAGADASGSTNGVKLSDVQLLLEPEIILKPRLRGSQVMELDQNFSLNAGQFVAWFQNSRWELRKVVSVDGKRLQLDGALPPTGTSIHLVGELERETGYSVTLPSQRRSTKVWDEHLNELSVYGYDEDNQITHTPSEVIREAVITSSDKVLFLHSDGSTLGKVMRSNLTELEFDGSPAAVKSGDWLVAASPSTSAVARVTRIDEAEDHFTLTVSGQAIPEDAVIHLGFAQSIRPKGHAENHAPLSGSSLQLDLTAAPAELKRGRQLIASAAGKSQELTITRVIAAPHSVSIEVEPALESGFTAFETILFGNVSTAGHGESKPEKVLGSGDATQMNQQMILAVPDISFIRDAHLPSGVAAAVDLAVEGQIWQQVASLHDSRPEDPHYTIRLTEDGHLLFSFGDGYHGRRLPSGRSNVRVSYRVGNGLAGNVAAGSLLHLAKPHPRIEAVQHPIESIGGNDLESPESLRENAPASTLAMERAVSLADFEALAVKHSGIWQAKAFNRPAEFGHQEHVRIAVVPAGGGSLGNLGEELVTFLASHATPGVLLDVDAYDPIPLNLDIEVQVKSEQFDPLDIVDAVRAHLLDHFSISKRKLGAGLYRSEIFGAVESIVGVENCSCRILPVDLPSGLPPRIRTGSDGTIRAIWARPQELIHLSDTQSLLSITHREFEL
ncbi:baseplate J/gp47 family protein [Haloferula chungangensis]|uniref:Baseplate J/gp47 family protein n=1 Tax=Haloferula chungangensis TaxID=1048331 RepID=A0ABW2L2N8_9BACT